MSMAGTEREPESTAPDVSVVTGLIRSGKSSMPKSTIYHRAQSLCRAWSCVSPFSSGGGAKQTTFGETKTLSFRSYHFLYVPCWHLSGAIINI